MLCNSSDKIIIVNSEQIYNRKIIDDDKIIKGGKFMMKKVNKVIEIINKVDIKDKLSVGVCMSESSYTN